MEEPEITFIRLKKIQKLFKSFVDEKWMQGGREMALQDRLSYTAVREKYLSNLIQIEQELTLIVSEPVTKIVKENV